MMSSTNRWKTYRAENDFYVTPIEHVRLFLDAFTKKIPIKDKRILDPCSWWDEVNEMPYPQVLIEQWVNPMKLCTLDIRENARSEYHWDFLQPVNTRKSREWKWYLSLIKPDVIISNVPFWLALEFLHRAMDMVNDWWYVIFLLRLNFVWSKKRKSFFDNHMPKYIYVHHERMSFSNWPTDSIEYAHFVWQKWYTGNSSELFIL